LDWTIDQILKLSPDAASAKAAQGLLHIKNWSGLGTDDRAAWGLCQGSGSKPYQTQIDLAEPAFKCSCPSRKFPCKHGLALFLLLVQERSGFKGGDRPDWVGKWLDSRSERAEKKQEKQAAAQMPKTPEALAKAEKTAARRLERVKSGAGELQRWLEDLVRTGIGSAASKDSSFWEGEAARLVDAQAPGLARLVREMAPLPASGGAWQERMLQRLAQMHLLLAAFGRIESLPNPVQDDIRSLVGWTEDQEAIKDQPGVDDEWLVLGQHTVMEDRLQVQRSWLCGAASQRSALVLTFAYGKQAPYSGLMPGTRFRGELVFFPGTLGLRALVKSRAEKTQSCAGFPGCNLAMAVDAWSATLSRHPWLERFPFALAQVTPQHRSGRWLLADEENRSIPLDPRFHQLWSMIALSGGRPLDVFGEWDGDSLLPLSAVAEGRFVELAS
jgi:hypothetical protein